MKPKLTTGAEISIRGSGVTVEQCFEDMARAMFSITTDLTVIHSIEIITFEFQEENNELALLTWLTLLLEKFAGHHLMFGDFRLKHEGHQWKATVSGEPWRAGIARETRLQLSPQQLLSLKKIDHQWQAECLLEIQA